jgi:hypothetical protein
MALSGNGVGVLDDIGRSPFVKSRLKSRLVAPHDKTTLI